VRGDWFLVGCSEGFHLIAAAAQEGEAHGDEGGVEDALPVGEVLWGNALEAEAFGAVEFDVAIGAAAKVCGCEDEAVCHGWG